MPLGATTDWNVSAWCLLWPLYSWVSRYVINFTGGQLQINTLSSDSKKFSLYVLTLCLAANVCNFMIFACSNAVQTSIHFWLTPTQNYRKGSSETQEYQPLMVAWLTNSLYSAINKPKTVC